MSVSYIIFEKPYVEWKQCPVLWINEPFEHNNLTFSCYEIVEPVTLTIRLRNGQIEKRRYGISEKLYAIDAKISYCKTPQNMAYEVLLNDGSYIIDWPKTFKVRKCYNF